MVVSEGQFYLNNFISNFLPKGTENFNKKNVWDIHYNYEARYKSKSCFLK